MQILFILILIAICPLMMFFMMRGMMGGGRSRETPMPQPALPNSPTQDARIAELQTEVARLSAARAADGSVAAVAAARGAAEPDSVITASTR